MFPEGITARKSDSLLTVNLLYRSECRVYTYPTAGGITTSTRWTESTCLGRRPGSEGPGRKAGVRRHRRRTGARRPRMGGPSGRRSCRLKGRGVYEGEAGRPQRPVHRAEPRSSREWRPKEESKRGCDERDAAPDGTEPEGSVY
jgi:hypothetical protein